MRSDFNSQGLDALNDAAGLQAGASGFDYFSTAFFMPPGKLDADQYLVNDLDGVTEGLFGSGNMNFLMMQAQQTNQALQSISSFEPAAGASGIAPAGLPVNGSALADTQNGTPSMAGATGNDSSTLQSSPPSGSLSTGGFASPFGAGGDSPPGAGFPQTGESIVSSLPLPAAGTAAQNGTTGINGSDGMNGGNAQDGSPGQDGQGGQDGQPGTPGTDGSDGGNGNDGNDGDTCGCAGGDTIIIVNEVVNEVVTIIEQTVIHPVTEIVTTITENIFNLVDNLLCDLSGIAEIPAIGLDLLLDLSNLTNLNLDIFSDNVVFNVIDKTLDLSPITSVTDLVADLTSSLHLNILLSPSHYDHSGDDIDINAIVDLGLPLLPPVILDLPLDPVEALLGDIDLALDTSSLLPGSLLDGLFGDGAGTGNDGGNHDTDLALANLAPDILLNPVEDILGDLDLSLFPGGLMLFGHGETGNEAGDNDIEAPLSLELGDLPLIGQQLSLTLDPLENIIGDVDLGAAGSINLLGDIAAPLIDDMAGGTGQDTLLSGIGNGLQDAVAGILPAGGDSDTDLHTDTNISLAGQELLDHALDIHLDPAEALLGNIDIALSPGLDLLGVYESYATDTDVSVPLDISILGHNLIDQTIHIPLDPVEQLLGDIDLDAGIHLDLIESPLDVGHAALDIIDDALSGATTLLADAPAIGGLLNLASLPGIGDLGDAALPWTENLLPDTGGLFGGGLGGNIADLLPDPVEGGLLAPVLTPPALSGLLGGGDEGARHFGGLFG